MKDKLGWKIMTKFASEDKKKQKVQEQALSKEILGLKILQQLSFRMKLEWNYLEEIRINIDSLKKWKTIHKKK